MCDNCSNTINKLCGRIKNLEASMSTLIISNRVVNQELENGSIVRGPDSATDEAIALYDGTTGKLIKNSE